MEQDNTVLIRKKKLVSDKQDSDFSDKTSFETPNKQGKNNKYLKAIAVFSTFISIFVFIALISYTVKDEVNARTSIFELFALLDGDETIKFRAENTHNWLGIMGAIISFSLYNGTFGLVILGFPMMLFLFSIELFRTNKISERFIKNFVVYLSLSIVISALMGSLHLSQIFGDIYKEFYGNIGLYLANITGSVLTIFGAFLLFFTLLLVIIILGTNIKVDKVLEGVIQGSEKGFNNIKDKVSDTKFTMPKMNFDFSVKNKVYDTKKKSEQESIEEIQETIKNDLQNTIKNNSDNNSENKSNTFEKVNFKPLSISISNKKVFTSFDEDIEELPIKEEIIEKEVFENKQIEEVESYEEVTQEIEVIEPDIHYSNNSVSSKISDLMKDLDEDNHIPQASKIEPIKIERITKIIEEPEEKIDEETEMKSIAPITFIKENETISKLNENSFSNKKLVIQVNDLEFEDSGINNFPISTKIHDENIYYVKPSMSLLKPPAKEEVVDDEELKMNARILQEKLETFKIYIENLQITPGPVVTQYEFTPAAGIKISRIESLADDLAMALKAKGIRIIAPIPGKGTVGIEIPNNNRSLVTFSSVLGSKKFAESDMHLPIILGKTISGETSIADLSKMPHLLIAGTTGSGKSVGVNTIIASLIYKKLPSELKFVMIDPKKVELQQYKLLKNHFIASSPDVKNPIVTDPVEAVALLKSTVLEMENRYDILAAAGQRNIADYNEKVKEGKYIHDKKIQHRPMPYIVVIIDEFADLMLTASKEIEEHVVRLAQMARAVGIHVVLATQRPSVDVITGIIKANLPSRIAYAVNSKIDSRTILDTSGAEQLLGYGDMLFQPMGKSKPDRIQNAFISTDEVDDLCEFIGNQKGYSEPYWLPSINEKEEGSGSISREDRDPLFDEAAKIIVQAQQGSVSLIQRRLKVGYARAGRMMDELYDAGIVGPFEGSKARQVYVENEEELYKFL